MRAPSSLLATAIAVATAASSVAAAQCPTPDGSLGKICLSDCKGDGLMVSAPALVSGITLGPVFHLDFDPTTGGSKLTNNGTVVHVKLPDSMGPIDLSFVTAGGSIYVTDGAGQLGGPVGVITIPDNTPAFGNSSTSSISMDMNGVSFAPLPGQEAKFPLLFAGITFGHGPVNLSLSGFASNDAIVRDKGAAPASDDPRICLRGVGLRASTSMIGLEGLNNVTITALPKILGGSPSTGLKLEVPVLIHNPSNVELNLNTDVNMGLTFQGQKVGSVTLPKLSLGLGDNAMTATSFMNPADDASKAAMRVLVSQFTGGVNSSISIGQGQAVGIPNLNAALGMLNIQQMLPSNQLALLQGAFVNASSGVAFDTTNKSNPLNKVMAWYNSTIQAYNPFDTPVTLVHVKGEIWWTNTTGFAENCGHVDVDLGFVLPPKQAVNSTPMRTLIDGSVRKDASNRGSADCLSKFVTVAIGASGVVVDIFSTMTIDIGGYQFPLDYNVKGITIKRKT